MEPEVDIQRIDGLWFTDDTVVLRAGKSAFRVTKSILAARSSVFQSMFEFPQPPATSGDATIDGKPVVTLHDDPEEATIPFTALTHAVLLQYFASYFMPPPASIDFHAVLGILRLSHKYDVNYLHKRALLHLETIFPVDFIEFGGRSFNKIGYSDIDLRHDLTAIPILHEVGATWLLPVAYYSVGTYGSRQMMAAGKAWDSLPVETKLVCAVLEALHLRASDRMNTFLGEHSECITAVMCTSNKDSYMRDMWALPDDDDNSGLMTLEFEPTWEHLPHILCHDCFLAARQRHLAARAAVWDKLPAHCGLEGWDVLKEKRRVALL
ncbi:hypothetical protein C8R43DRAFT_894768 [Mycena crocata]|nr:hypothetical protein C8R43DRAFT_894768 [Mycena crocata]